MIDVKKSILIIEYHSRSREGLPVYGATGIRSNEGMYNSKRKTFLFLKNRKVFEELKHSTSFYKQRGIKEYFARNQELAKDSSKNN